MRRLQEASWWPTRGISLSPTLGIIQYLSIPPVIPIHTLIQPSFKAIYWLSTYCVSPQRILIIHHSVSEQISMSVLNLSFSSLYPFPRILSWLLISKTWSMFPLLIPFTHLKISIISPLALLSKEWRLRCFNLSL